jgi:hypothetical protein
MQFGLFDHVEHGDRPLARLFDERLKFVEAAEAAAFIACTWPSITPPR